jgi:hypothetical protein
MALSADQRLSIIEQDLSRILELLQSGITVDTASKQVRIADTNTDSILSRIRRIEYRIEGLKYKWQIAYKKSKL